ncbi:hypothetical protein ACJIZ3_008799 [Penstemon smallii]|uniref:DUF4283 domain-containing protein n=1 Tax=Penstemon smallii TaxID=265156 RepID=A0ABD3TCX9_9LAMI
MVPWVYQFKDNRNVGHGIKLAAISNDQDIVVLDDEDIDDVETAWGFCLIGYFAGRFPGHDAVHQISVDRDRVLEGGPYFIHGRPLLLKIMSRCFEFGNNGFSSVPVWINIPDLPLECWNAKSLSKIVLKVGKPIATDKLTLTKERLSYARVMIQLPNGKVRLQKVIFEHAPKFCKNCNFFAHSTLGCNLNFKDSKTTASNSLASVVPEAHDSAPNVVSSDDKPAAVLTTVLNQESTEVPFKVVPGRRIKPSKVTDQVSAPSDKVDDPGQPFLLAQKDKGKSHLSQSQNVPKGRTKGIGPLLPL